MQHVVSKHFRYFQSHRVLFYSFTLYISVTFVCELTYRKSSIKALLGALFISSPFDERGAYLRGGLFHFEKAITSLVHKQLGHKVEMLKYKKNRGHVMQESQLNSNLQFLNKP